MKRGLRLVRDSVVLGGLRKICIEGKKGNKIVSVPFFYTSVLKSLKRPSPKRFVRNLT
jgi:hypothetical protein